MDLLSPVEIEAINLSIRVAVWATVFSLPIAVAVALGQPHDLGRDRAPSLVGDRRL